MHQFNDIVFDVDFEGRPWISTGEGDIYSLDGETWIDHEVPSNAFGDLPRSTAKALGFDSLGRLWVLYHGYYLSVYDGESWNTFDFDKTGLNIYSVPDFTIDQYDRVWLVTSDGGLVMIDTDGEWVDFTPYGSGITIDGPQVITTDQRGRIWIGSKGGVAIFSPPLP